MVTPKAPWASKTLWFNGLALLISVALAFGFGDFTPDPAVGEASLVVVTVVNLVLRFLTKAPIGTPPA